MAVVFDPHESVKENVQVKEPRTLATTGPRFIFPKFGAFYYDSLEVWNGVAKLVESEDYYVTHPYVTGILRTGRVANGGLWIINPALRSVQLTYHPIGINIPTDTQYEQERLKLGTTNPGERHFENIIGDDAYFPPVDIQFDWETWIGEDALMESLAAIGRNTGGSADYPDVLADPNVHSYEMGVIKKDMPFDPKTGKYELVGKSMPLVHTIGKGAIFGDYLYDAEFFLPLGDTTDRYSTLYMYVNNNWMTSNFVVLYDKPGQDQIIVEVRQQFNTSPTIVVVSKSILFKKEWFAKPFRVKIIRSQVNNTVSISISNDTGLLGTVFIDHNNPPPEAVSTYATYKIAAAHKNLTDIQTQLRNFNGGYIKYFSAPGYIPKENANLPGIMQSWLDELRRVYSEAPAHNHITLKNNPHLEDYGWIGALKRNGLASDAAKAYGLTLAQLTLSVNNQLPTLAQITAQKMLTTGGPITGPIITSDGLTKFSRGPNDTSYDSVTKIDKGVSGSTAKGNIRATSLKLVTMQAGNGSLVLYPDLPSGLKWNGKKILTSDTIGPYVPIGGELAKGFYGQPTTTVTLTGKGIGTDPFIATWKPPSKTEPSTAAMRTLTSNFGNSETLAATPALIKKLDPYFTGKLNKDTATINGVKLEGSVILSKTSMGIDLVPNISDALMPMSDAMETLISGYEDDPDHIHPMSVFGIVNATTTLKGLVKLGKKTTATNLALDGGEVAPEAARIKRLEDNSVDILQPDIIRVVRFGDSGTGQADVIEANDNNYLVTLAASKYFVLKRYTVPALTFNLVDLFPLDYANNTFYVYVDIVNGAAQYDVTLGQTPETDERTMIGSITTDLDGVVRDVINNVTRLGMFRQLEEHMANPDAHIKKFATKNSIGLDKVENVTTVVDSPAKGAAADWANNKYATAGWMIEFFSPLSRYRVQKGLMTANDQLNGLASNYIAQIKPIALTQITWKPGNLPLPAGLDLYVAFEGLMWTSFGQLR